MFPSAFVFTQTEWFLPPHWSRAVVYESLNDVTEDTTCFSLWDRGKLSVVCKTESIPALVANVCERNYKENKKKKKNQWWIIFVHFVCCCDFAFTTVLERVYQEQRRGMKGEEFFLFSSFFFYFALSLPLHLSHKTSIGNSKSELNKNLCRFKTLSRFR